MTASQPKTSGTTGSPWLLAGVPSGSEALVLAELLAGRMGPGKPSLLLHIAVNDRAMESLTNTLGFFAPEVEVLTFPAWDCMPYDRASPHPSLMAARMRTLAALAADTKSSRPRIVIATAGAILQKLPPRSAMRQVSFSLRVSGKL
ncbi:MAG: hypothetical protein EBV03_01715, partial [Proteobacteria bacterium]|nr:hypothetical protein [Pseudomonadota bacterium]